jgi:phosphotransferase system HPr (HPr) family protein
MPETLKNKRQAAASQALTVRRTFVMLNVHGLHARPAALLVKQLSRFDCEVTVECGGELASAKSLLGLLGLAAGAKSRITFTAVGARAPQAMEAIGRLFENRFEEAY